MPEPLLSAIITSFTTQRLKDIFQLLEQMAAQSYARLEIIFVSEVQELCERVTAFATEKDVPSVKVLVNEGRAGATGARNFAIEQAQGEILAFIDDDALPFPDWAQELVKTYADASVVSVTGPVLPLWEDQAMEWFPSELDWVFGCTRWLGAKEMQEVRSVNGTNSSFRREALELAGGYSTMLGPRRRDRDEWTEFGEETELSLRVREKTGGRIVYNPRVKVYHKIPRTKFSRGFIAQRAYQVGRTRRMIKTLYPSDKYDVLTPEFFLLRRIVTGLLPRTSAQLFRRPGFAVRRLVMTIYVLSFVTLGYYSHLLGGRKQHIPEA